MVLAVGLFVLLLAPEAYLPLRQVGVQFHAAAEGVAATADVFAVLDAARAQSTAPPAAQTTRDAGSPARLELRGLRVRRGDRMLPAVDLVAQAGEVVLIEGPSGSGKTSILAALRGAAAYEGEASWAASPVSSLSPASWLAWAGQRPGLIAGTVAVNIALGSPDPDARRIARALDLAAAENIDPALELGVQGGGLSGGQAQRVAVARALYRHLTGVAPVIALDEPSSALDAETERALWARVREVADAGALELLVSHRASARDIADRILSLRGAEVIA
jgi:ATP-binding cassette subfamily C protein CydD